MIIVGQLDDRIVNFDNVNSIIVKDSYILVFDNSYNGLSDCSEILGEYATYDRAKEVLQEIIDTFIEKEYFHINKSSLNNLDELAEPKYILRPVGSPKVYYMPKE